MKNAACESVPSFLFISSPNLLFLLQTSALSLPGPRAGRQPTRSASPPWRGSSTSSSRSNRALKTWYLSTPTDLPRYESPTALFFLVIIFYVMEKTCSQWFQSWSIRDRKKKVSCYKYHSMTTNITKKFGPLTLLKSHSENKILFLVVLKKNSQRLTF